MQGERRVAVGRGRGMGSREVSWWQRKAMPPLPPKIRSPIARNLPSSSTSAPTILEPSVAPRRHRMSLRRVIIVIQRMG